MDLASHDAQLRQAAFSHVDRLATIRGGVIDSADLAGGFEFGGERIPLINPQRGIFKPRQMEHLLSIKTVFPRRGARVWYDDQRDAHRQIYAGDDVVDYQFMGTDPNSADNRWLRNAMPADPDHLFPRHVAGPLSAHHPDVYRWLAPRAITS
jgi:putative restriction endonuclease